MISRLLVDKGVRECLAAKLSVHYYYGHLDENPSGINQNELNLWINKEILNI